MKLSSVVNRFAKTSISGWDGANWVNSVGKIDFLPSSRFISAHEFDTKVQYVLTPIGATALDTYPVVRVDVTNQVWLVGMETFDVSGRIYSKFYALRRAESMCDVCTLAKNLAASGMAKTNTRTIQSTEFCSLEHITSAGSKVFPNAKYSDVMVYLPRSCTIAPDNELIIDNKIYDIKDVFATTGFMACRAYLKGAV